MMGLFAVYFSAAAAHSIMLRPQMEPPRPGRIDRTASAKKE
jgi:hypothetical protein